MLGSSLVSKPAIIYSPLAPVDSNIYKNRTKSVKKMMLKFPKAIGLEGEKCAAAQKQIPGATFD